MAVTINGTTGITDVNGSAATPAITGLDTDTGLYFGTNLLGLSTAGTSALYIDSSQNIGIGTTTPANKLTVSGTGALFVVTGNSSANQTQDVQITRTSSSTTIQTGPNITFNDGTTNNTWAIQTGSGNLQFFSYIGSWQERMRIDSSGNVGIGTTSPATKLFVNGDTRLGNGYALSANGV